MHLFSADARVFSEKKKKSHENMKNPPSKNTHNGPQLFFQYWPNCPNDPKTEITYHQKQDWVTPARTLLMSGLKSRVLKLSFLSLKMMVKIGLEFYFEIHRAPSELLLPSAKKSAK